MTHIQPTSVLFWLPELSDVALSRDCWHYIGRGCFQNIWQGVQCNHMSHSIIFIENNFYQEDKIFGSYGGLRLTTDDGQCWGMA